MPGEVAPQPTILIVEDEPEIRRFLRISLVNHGYTLLETPKGEEGLTLLAEKKPALVILDLGLPDLDGVTFTRRAREWSSVPIIVLSARTHEQDKIDALEAGADDYVTKPFGILELLARIKVAFRHSDKVASSAAEEPVFTTGDIKVDLAKRTVYVKGEEVHCTPIEYQILTMLVKNADRVVTQQVLLREIWGPGHAKQGHYLRVYVGTLRQKLEEQSARPKYLITEPGVGYRLRVIEETNGG
ncbi:MAG: response regulator [Candidatus Melainabacteria bacterium]|nr:response regulator [Candidatus Melainabacteria bacterium]